MKADELNRSSDTDKDEALLAWFPEPWRRRFKKILNKVQDRADDGYKEKQDNHHAAHTSNNIFDCFIFDIAPTRSKKVVKNCEVKTPEDNRGNQGFEKHVAEHNEIIIA